MSEEASSGESPTKRRGVGPQGSAPVGASNASLNSGQSQPPVGGSASGHTMSVPRGESYSRKTAVDLAGISGTNRGDEAPMSDERHVPDVKPPTPQVRSSGKVEAPGSGA